LICSGDDRSIGTYGNIVTSPGSSDESNG
jgi:hypothetical protein